MIVVMLIVSISLLSQISHVHGSTSYIIHSPIQIIGNSGFTPQNGVTGGKGTHSDPYLIAGWSIAAANGQAAIRIQSTTAYFLISHVQLLNAQPGVYLTGVANGGVETSTLTNSNFGIRIESSTNVIILGNSISGYNYGVYSADALPTPQTTGLTITNNTFSVAGAWISSSQSSPSNLNITGNTFLSAGILATSYGATVARNSITGGSSTVGGGLTVEGNNSLVSDNSVIGGDIQVSGSGTIVSDNKADRILLDAATAITLTNNVMTKGVLIPTLPPFDTPPFYDSHIMTGNTVNGKPLSYFARCSGANIDGSTAGEVIVASCTNVRVAHMKLSGGDEGIMMVYVRQGGIVANDLSGVFTGIDILDSSNLQVSGNYFNGTKVSVSNTDNVALTGNLGTGGAYPSIVTIAGGSGISVSNNTLKGNTAATALSLADVANATVAGNWVSGSADGIMVSGANGLNITSNNIVRNRIGLTLDLGGLNGIFNSVIYHNNFVDNTEHQAAYQPQVVAVFDNGYPSGGNYWSDYNAVDNCSGPQQNICSGPDGIGDKPYTGIWELGYETPGALGTLIDNYPLSSPYGNLSWDTSAPSWPSGSGLTVAIVNSTSLTLHWTRAVDDVRVSSYRVYQDDTLMATLPGYVQNYTVAHLVSRSTHAFKVEAGDPAGNWSVDGPSANATLPQAGNPSSTSQPFFTISWWMEHWYLGIITGGSIGLAVAGIFLIQRRKP